MSNTKARGIKTDGAQELLRLLAQAQGEAIVLYHKKHVRPLWWALAIVAALAVLSLVWR